jgi:hypothetical protein
MPEHDGRRAPIRTGCTRRQSRIAMMYGHGSHQWGAARAPTVCAALLLLPVEFALNGAHAAPAAECRAAMQQIDDYDREVTRAIDGEVQDLPSTLQRHARVHASGDAAQASRIDTRLRAGMPALRSVDPPAPLTALHAVTVDYYDAVLTVLDAQVANGRTVPREGYLDVWQHLHRFFTTMRVFLVENGCDTQDLGVLDRRFLPAIDAEIARLQEPRTTE